MSRFFLGLDSSTQGLTAVCIDADAGRIAYTASLVFDEACPEYGTRNGVLPNDDPRVAHAPPLLWVEALDRMLARMRADGVDMGALLAVAGSGQQHGSVYLRPEAERALARLDPARPAADQLRGLFSRSTAPIWMDSSTTVECAEIAEALGGPQAVAEITGSAPFERFTGPQIRKFWKTEPGAYEATGHIALVSSFLASVLSGRIAPIDYGDGSGMHLMGIGALRWHPAALEATAPGLAARLPELVPSWTVVGPVSPFIAARHGMNPEALSVAWSGDNPCSAVGLGLTRPGAVAISLGTSDTFFGAMPDCRIDPRGEGHVFASPAGGYLSLICFKNGSLARERVRARYGLDWAAFSEAIRRTPPGNNGGLMLPYFEPEIVPKVLTPGVRRRGLDEADAAANCRAVVEAQMLSMRLHSQWMGVRPERIYATGGASVNDAILRIMADVHGCPVYRFETANSAALGAALRAHHGWLQAQGDAAPWDEIVACFAKPVASSRIDPDPAARPVYDAALAAYAEFEREVSCKE